MTRWFKLGVLAAAPATALWPYDAPPILSAQDLLAKVSARYEEIDDFRADLVVATSSALMGDAGEQAGVVYARSPNLFRLEFTRPYAQTVVFDGAHMFVVTPGSNQVLRSDGAGFAALVNLPQALKNLEKDYRTELVAATAGATYELLLTARTPGTLFPAVTLWVDRERFLIMRADLRDNAGGTTSYRFSDYRFDLGLPADRFTFTPAPGAEVVDMGGGP